MKLPKIMSVFKLIILIPLSLSACNVVNAYSRYAGVTYLTSLGNPPADTLIWSPHESTKILVNALDGNLYRNQVYILDTITKDKRILADTDVLVRGNSWSEDGKNITLTVAGGTKGILKRGVWNLNTQDNSIDYINDTGTVIWLPDGKSQALFDRDYDSKGRSQQSIISLINIQTGVRNVVYTNGQVTNPEGFTSSGDGRHLSFALGFGEHNTSDLYVLDLENRIATQITHDGISSFPQWSPKGNIIAYNKIPGSNIISMHLINSDGSCDFVIPKIDYAISPTWSPDGKQLAFIGPDGIYVIDLQKFLGRDIYQNLCQ